MNSLHPCSGSARALPLGGPALLWPTGGRNKAGSVEQRVLESQET